MPTTMRLVRCALGLLAAMACTCATADVIAGTGSPSGTTLGARTATRLVGAPSGLGHALIMPYYNTQNGNVSVFSITNTDFQNAKVLKVRIRGASNGDSLLSFTVLLGPMDVWNASLRRGANGVAELTTSDKTCTVPRLAADVAQPLSTSRLTLPSWTDADKANQTREGYVEILNMADIPIPDSSAPAAPLVSTVARRFASALCDESVIRTAIGDVNYSSEAAAAAQGLAAPTGKLGGKWIIINVPETTTFSGSMYALRAVDASGKDARANFVLFPQTDAAYTGAIDNVTSDPLLRRVAYASKTLDGVASNPTTGPVLNAAMHDLPDLSTPYVVAPGSDAALVQADRLTGSMAAKLIQNEYATEPTLAARTAWAISMPARRYSAVLDNRAAPAPSRRLFSVVPPNGEQYFGSENTFVRAPSNEFCVYSAMSVLDREGYYLDFNYYFGAYPQALTICGTASILTFGEFDSGTYSVARSFRDSFTKYTNGWTVLNLQSSSPKGFFPVIGSAFIRFYNPSVSPGISGNYGITFDHWVKR